MFLTKENFFDIIDEFSFRGKKIPGYMQTGLYNYLFDGLSPGGFLEAILTNDLFGAVHKADNTNIELIPVYVAFIYGNFPINTWGSYEKYSIYSAKKQSEVLHKTN